MFLEQEIHHGVLDWHVSTPRYEGCWLPPWHSAAGVLGLWLRSMFMIQHSRKREWLFLRLSVCVCDWPMPVTVCNRFSACLRTHTQTHTRVLTFKGAQFYVSVPRFVIFPPWTVPTDSTFTMYRLYCCCPSLHAPQFSFLFVVVRNYLPNRNTSDLITDPSHTLILLI